MIVENQKGNQLATRFYSNYFFNLGLELIKLNQDVLFLSPLHKNNYLNKIPKKHKHAVNLKKFPFRFNPLIEKINHYF